MTDENADQVILQMRSRCKPIARELLETRIRNERDIDIGESVGTAAPGIEKSPRQGSKRRRQSAARRVRAQFQRSGSMAILLKASWQVLARAMPLLFIYRAEV